MIHSPKQSSNKNIDDFRKLTIHASRILLVGTNLVRAFCTAVVISTSSCWLAKLGVVLHEAAARVRFEQRVSGTASLDGLVHS